MPKMARDAAEVLAFLRDLATRSKPWAERDFAELAAFARDELGLPELAPWDLAYASEKLKAARYSFSDQEVRQYFPEDRVLAGLFGLVETIYGVEDPRGEGRSPGTPDVRFFEVVDGAGSAGRAVLPRQLRARRQAGRRVDGRRDQPPPGRLPRAAAGHVPDLQPLGAGGRQARARSRTTKC